MSVHHQSVGLIIIRADNFVLEEVRNTTGESAETLPISDLFYDVFGNILSTSKLNQQTQGAVYGRLPVVPSSWILYGMHIVLLNNEN